MTATAAAGRGPAPGAAARGKGGRATALSGAVAARHRRAVPGAESRHHPEPYPPLLEAAHKLLGVVPPVRL